MAIELRKGNVSKEHAINRIAEFEGKRPASLDIFLDMLGISEAQFDDIIKNHRIDPWSDKVFLQIGKPTHDLGSWQAKPPIPKAESEKMINHFKEGGLATD
jgi:hypothetical protein